jgi:DNA-binding IclR family transcriptional regulator
MACINSDGSLTRTARIVLRALRSPGTEMDIAELTDLAFYQVRASLRELVELGLLEKYDDLYQITPAGLEKLD